MSEHQSTTKKSTATYRYVLSICAYCQQEFSARVRAKSESQPKRRFCTAAHRILYQQTVEGLSKGQTAWSKGLKIDKALYPNWGNTGNKHRNKTPIGTIRIWTKKGSGTRAYIKVAEPSAWKRHSHWVWEQANGPVPPKMHLHHKDRNMLNDALDNLECLSNADHRRAHLQDEVSPLHLINVRKAVAKVTPELVRLIRQQRAEGMSYAALIKLHNRPKGTLQDIVLRKTWKDVE